MLTAPLLSQTTWQTTNTPAGGFGTHCYDSVRRVMVLTERGNTYELDGVGNWNWIPGWSPGPRSAWFGGIAFAANRQRVVLHDNLTTWEWDGVAWSSMATTPPNYDFLFMVEHEARGTAIAFGGVLNPWTANDLYEWDGSAWNLIPTTNKPPRPGDYNASRVYLQCAYDARRDKIVLFGSAWHSWSSQQLSNLQPDIWEWDVANGWVNRAVPGTIGLDLIVHYDSQRGTLIKAHGQPQQMAEWDGGASWAPLLPVQVPWPGLSPKKYWAYDHARGLLFMGMGDSSNQIAYTYGTVNPAAFESLTPGCSGTLGQPTLALTHNWTRAWMGRALSVDLQNLPQSAGFLVMGWSDQQAGSFQLPLDLTPFGMAGCLARVASDHIVPLVGANQAATMTMPVPQNGALLGVTLYQQGFALDPAANGAGLTASNSVRVTVGRL